MLAHSHDCLGDWVMKLTNFLQALALTVCLPLQAAPAKWCDADQNWCHISLETKSGVTLVLDYRLCRCKDQVPTIGKLISRNCGSTLI
jgi:hypothetical protein